MALSYSNIFTIKLPQPPSLSSTTAFLYQQVPTASAPTTTIAVRPYTPECCNVCDATIARVVCARLGRNRRQVVVAGNWAASSAHWCSLVQHHRMRPDPQIDPQTNHKRKLPIQLTHSTPLHTPYSILQTPSSVAVVVVQLTNNAPTIVVVVVASHQHPPPTYCQDVFSITRHGHTHQNVARLAVLQERIGLRETGRDRHKWQRTEPNSRSGRCSMAIVQWNTLTTTLIHSHLSHPLIHYCCYYYYENARFRALYNGTINNSINSSTHSPLTDNSQLSLSRCVRAFTFHLLPGIITSSQVYAIQS